MVFAPILITTCNRAEHFQKCIESLKGNKYALYTELFISLDYPPGDKYIEGNKVIKGILEEGIAGFKKVHIFYQTKNLGAYDNERFLVAEAYKNYDRYIFTEDDNVFAPNFIEYIDKGLEIFEENEEIVAICATRASEGNMSYDCGNIVKSKKFCGYGFGTWKEKEECYIKTLSKNYYEKIARNRKQLFLLYKTHSSIYFSYVATLLKKKSVFLDSNGEVACIDEAIKIYNIIENKYVIHPLSTVVINIGEDGSGLNSQNLQKKQDLTLLTTEDTFEYEIGERINIRTYSAVDKGKLYIIRSLADYILLSLYKIFGTKNFFAIYGLYKRK